MTTREAHCGRLNGRIWGTLGLEVLVLWEREIGRYQGGGETRKKKEIGTL